MQQCRGSARLKIDGLLEVSSGRREVVTGQGDQSEELAAACALPLLGHDAAEQRRRLIQSAVVGQSRCRGQVEVLAHARRRRCPGGRWGGA